MKNTSEFAKAYALLSQGLAVILVLGVGGFFLGRWINRDSALSGILAIVGVIIGIVIFITYALKIGLGGDSNKGSK
ncbi:MAG: hypothetical protein ACRC5M_01845 [Anaeroplasmataceae bacterium]